MTFHIPLLAGALLAVSTAAAAIDLNVIAARTYTAECPGKSLGTVFARQFRKEVTASPQMQSAEQRYPGITEAALARSMSELDKAMPEIKSRFAAAAAERGRSMFTDQDILEIDQFTASTAGAKLICPSKELVAPDGRIDISKMPANETATIAKFQQSEAGRKFARWNQDVAAARSEIWGTVFQPYQERMRAALAEGAKAHIAISRPNGR